MGLGPADAACAGLPWRNFATSEDAQSALRRRYGCGNASARSNRAPELLGREANLFTEKIEVGKPGDFDHISDEELMKFIEAQGEVVRELERKLLPPSLPKQRKGATKR